MPDLNLCPFCGGNVALVARSAPGLLWAVQCEHLRCRGPEFKSKRAAAKAWNRVAVAPA